MSKGKGGKFLLGATLGAALGVLFAPAKGSETRRALKKTLDDLVDKVEEVDLEEVRDLFDEKIDAIRAELEDLNKEKVTKIAKEKAKDVKNKAEELFELAKEKGTPVLEDAAKEVLEKVVQTSEETLKKLESKKN
ncbi:MAG: YtxH domain-containing protein [Bacilli bacterium]|nr:YtxH domain-containing protein [Bacilli bacterium]MDD3304876.1 YtxH domain-containing protein [Bacilli bacterium]MDD4054171.1 YtxH domain-containing protein [Bacilli bacterium]MDD4411995.1 YtxH domain-containing protein [Bacilli bacterium]